MAVFRVERNKGYTVMSNHHLRNKELSLKAKGLLSQMLSLPEDWDYTLKGLSLINREKIDAIREAIKELERAGYIVRSRERDEKGRLRGADYVIFEQPQPPTPDLPTLENPTLDNPMQEKPTLEKPTLENPTQLNKDIQRTDLPKKEKSNTDLSSTHSIPILSPNPSPCREAAAPPERKGTEAAAQSAVDIYREIIKDNIDYHILKQDMKFDSDRLDEIVDLMLETVCTARKRVRIAGDDYPAELVKSKFMKLDGEHKCPYTDCGFVFASAAMFSKYYAAAEDALRKSDFDLARKYLFEAQSADPSEKRRIEQLSSTINSEEIRHKEPINKLKALTSAKKFVKAQAELSQIIQRYPNLNIADIEKNIREAIAKADAAFVSAQQLTSSKRADVCVSILQYCADHQPSLNFLRATQPAPIKNLSATADNAKGCINLAWSITAEQGIKYHLIRKNGRKPPVSISDGTVLLEEDNASSYCDKTATPGNTYSYSLFVSRVGVFSDAVTKVAVLYSDVQGLRAVQNRDSVRLTWDMPQNNAGATVTRTAAGRETVLSRSAYGSFEDSNIQYGVAYTYKVSVNYSDSMSSPGVKVLVTPLVIIDSFRIKAAHVKDNVYKVSWDIKQPNVDLRIMVNKSLVSECTSDANAVQIALPKESFSTISVMAYSGGKWVESDNSVQANTYSSCSIDKNRTELVEETIVTPKGTVYSIELKIRLAKGMPNNVAGFYYAVRTTSSASRWATIEEIGKAHDINKISIKKYSEKDGIIYSESVKDERTFYISVFTIYDVGGKEVISEPKTAKVDRTISADLFWKVSKGFLGPLKLTISIVGNRPIEHVPELVLCGCNDGEFILTHDDPKAVEFIRINAVDLDKPQKDYTQSYDLERANYYKNMKFFLFETNPVRSEKFTLRWFQGFSGKV